jgi:hypothetical protein
VTVDWQLVAVLAAVAVAVGYVARAAWKTWFGRKVPCASACGGCAKPADDEGDARRIALPRV